ncbi:MAG: hypothetical protein CMJ23_14365 [Phycisphaerae bacterium]|nr:hypothetical protein [Phycisphaerae bacterium]
MTFLAPGLAIAGLLAAGVPIIIHLLLRRKRVPVPWAAMALLMEAARRHRRRSRIERWFLLVVRALILALLGVALAGPLLGERVATLESVTMHLVIDDGIVSGVTGEGGITALDQQVEAAIELVNGLEPSARVSVVLAGRPVRTLIQPATTDHRSVVSALEGVLVREGATDLASALDRIAIAINDGDVKGGHEVRLFSDLRRGSINDRTRPPALSSPDGDIRLVTTTPTEARVQSVQIVNIDVARVPLSLAGGGDDRLVSVRLRRTGETPESSTTIRIAGDAIAAPETRRVEWTAGVTDATVDFQMRVDEDGGVLEALILEPDGLTLDDRRSTMVEGRVPSRILILDRDDFGGVGRVDRWRATDWFERALLPDLGGDLAEAVEIDRVDPAALNQRDLDGVSVLVVGRPDLLDDEFLPELVRWTNEGGVLVTMPPGSTTVRPWATPLLDSLGLDWSVALEAESLEEPRRLSSNQPASALTRLLDAEISDLAPSVSINRRLPIEGPNDGDVVLVDDADEPFLIDVPIGLGRLVFFTVAPELDWTDLPVRPLMVPLVQEITRQGTALAARGRDGVVGERPPTARTSGAAMILPGGDRIVLDADSDEIDQDRLPTRSGVAEVVDLSDRILERRVVNPAVDQAKLETIERDEVLEWLSPSGDWVIESESDQVEVAAIIGTDIAGMLVVLVLFLVLFETVLARWFARGGIVNRRSRGLTGANAEADAARMDRTEAVS